MESKKYSYRIVTTPVEGLFMPQRSYLDSDDWGNCWLIGRTLQEAKEAIKSFIIEDNFTPEVVAE